MSWNAGRTPSRCAAVATCGDECGGKICRRLPQDLVGLLQLAELAFKGLHPLDHLGRDTNAVAPINLRLLDPLVQRL